MKRLAIRIFVLWAFAATAFSPVFVRIGRASNESSPSQDENGNAVTHWNSIATEIFPFSPGPILDVRAFSIFHASIHDALNAIQRRYKPYAADFSSPGASIDAAVASASRHVLLELSPENSEKIEEDYHETLAEIPNGKAKNDGIELGRKCAQVNLEKRANDGTAEVNEPAYVPTHKPGDYDFTPPFNKPPFGPAAFFTGFGRLTPFGIDPEKHRVPGPDSLQSETYAKDFDHLKSIGELKSTTRTADQTEIAFFWFEGSGTWNQISNTVFRKTNMDEWEAARVFTLLNFAMTDSLIVCFDAKYHFRFWRPFTAIRRADEDDNSSTEPDEKWRSLLWHTPNEIPPKFFIPPIPEYPSAASSASSAAAEILILTFGDDVSFDATSETLPNVTRHYESFSQAAKENRFSRVYGGIHFLKAIRDGFHLGKGVGEVISKMLPKVNQ